MHAVLIVELGWFKVLENVLIMGAYVLILGGKLDVSPDIRGSIVSLDLMNVFSSLHGCFVA